MKATSINLFCLSTRECVCVQFPGPFRECPRVGRFRAWLPRAYYCTPLVCFPAVRVCFPAVIGACVSAVIGALSVWRQNTKIKKGCVYVHMCSSLPHDWALGVSYFENVSSSWWGWQLINNPKFKKNLKEFALESSKSGFFGLSYYCAPLVCIPGVIGVLTMWRLNKPETENPTLQPFLDLIVGTCEPEDDKSCTPAHTNYGLVFGALSGRGSASQFCWQRSGTVSWVTSPTWSVDWSPLA